MSAAYRFSVRFRLDPADVQVTPAAFETALSRPADPPGESGWLFFRDYLWRGECSDPAHVRAWASEALGVPVEEIAFRAFETDPDHWDAFRKAVAADLDAFRADDVADVVSKYFGSSVEVEGETP